jgi:hypothetical protein
MYFWIFDDSKADITLRVANAIARYTDRFHAAPAEALLSRDDFDTLATRPAGVVIEPRGNISKNNFWLGPIGDNNA